MTFWCGSGSGDPSLWLMDPDPVIFVIDLQDANRKLFFWSLLFEDTFTSFFKDKSKKSQNRRNQGFSYYFCLMIEGSGSGIIPYLWLMDPNPDPGGPKTYGSATLHITSGILIRICSWNEYRLPVATISNNKRQVRYSTADLRLPYERQESNYITIKDNEYV